MTLSDHEARRTKSPDTKSPDHPARPFAQPPGDHLSSLLPAAVASALTGTWHPSSPSRIALAPPIIVNATTLLLFFAFSFLLYQSPESGSDVDHPVQMATTTLKFLTVAPRVKHTATVIFAHVSFLWQIVSLLCLVLIDTSMVYRAWAIPAQGGTRSQLSSASSYPTSNSSFHMRKSKISQE